MSDRIKWRLAVVLERRGNLVPRSLVEAAVRHAGRISTWDGKW